MSQKINSLDYNGTSQDLINYSDMMRDSMPSHYVPNKQKPVLHDNKVQCIFVFGARGSGKSFLIEQYAEWYYRRYITPLYLWGARSNENVFMGVNKNCGYHWNEMIGRQEKLLEMADSEIQRENIQKMLLNAKNSLHCNCRNTYPVSWLVPDYWEFSNLKQYNTCWFDKTEYIIALNDKKINKPYNELTLIQRDELDHGKLEKPRHLQTELIRVCPFTVPSNPKKSEEFGNQFLKYLLDARKEHRWLVMNPLMFLTADDKFKTISNIITRLPVWMEDHFQPNTPESVGKLRGINNSIPYNEWTKQEKNWHKAVLVFSELRTLAPTNKFSPETKSSMSKRSIVDLSAELRHKNLYLIGDLQSSEDLNESIKPLSDFVVIKNATQQLLGKEYFYFLQGIEKRRNSMLMKITHGQYVDLNKAPSQYKQYLDRFIPRIQELPVNKAFVVWHNNEYKLITVNGASWHHKQEGESLQSITRITWKLNKDQEKLQNVEEYSEQTIKPHDNSKKQNVLAVMKWCVEEFIRSSGWLEVVQNLKKKVELGELPLTSVSDLDHKTISNKIRKDDKMKSNLEIAKKMKDKPSEEIINALKW